MNRKLHTWLFPALLALITAVSVAADSSDLEFRGRIVRVTTLQEHSGSAIATHFDPRFAVTVGVVSARPESVPFVNGKLVVLAIHSPAQVFSADADSLAGRTFDFALTRTTGNGRTSYSALAARDPK